MEKNIKVGRKEKGRRAGVKIKERRNVGREGG